MLQRDFHVKDIKIHEQEHIQSSSSDTNNTTLFVQQRTRSNISPIHSVVVGRINGQYSAKTVYIRAESIAACCVLASRVSSIRRKHEPRHSKSGSRWFRTEPCAKGTQPVAFVQRKRPEPLVSLLLDPCSDYVCMNTKLRPTQARACLTKLQR